MAARVPVKAVVEVKVPAKAAVVVEVMAGAWAWAETASVRIAATGNRIRGACPVIIENARNAMRHCLERNRY